MRATARRLVFYLAEKFLRVGYFEHLSGGAIIFLQNVVQVRQVQLIEHGRAGHHLVPVHDGAASFSRVVHQYLFFEVDRFFNIFHVEPAEVFLDEEGRDQPDERDNEP